MKYVGYFLFLLAFIALVFIQAARDFFNESLALAPEITTLVAFCYLYIVGITIALSLFPKLVQNRALLYEIHIKMACSVMVSLGLVGTFLGLVDMIAGIAAALSGEESDFGARMAKLLSAISSSLGAMSFAFMTSILGVGMSAYGLVAGTFVLSSFKEDEKDTKQDKGIKQDKANQHFDKTDATLKRIKILEENIMEIKLNAGEHEIAPSVIFNTLSKYHNDLAKQNKILLNNINELNKRNAALVGALEHLSQTVGEISKNSNTYHESFNDIKESIDKQNVYLSKIDLSAKALRDHTENFSSRIKRMLN